MIPDLELLRKATTNQGACVHDVQKDIAVYTGWCKMHEKRITGHPIFRCLICNTQWNQILDACPNCKSTRQDQIQKCLDVVNERRICLEKVAYP